MADWAFDMMLEEEARYDNSISSYTDLDTYSLISCFESTLDSEYYTSNAYTELVMSIYTQWVILGHISTKQRKALATHIVQQGVEYWY